MKKLCLFIAMMPIAVGYCSDEKKQSNVEQLQTIISHHNGFIYPDNRVAYQNMEKLYPNATLFNGNQIWKISSKPSSLNNLIIKDGSQSYSLDEIGNYRKIDSIVVLKNSKIRYEKYFNGQTEYTRHHLNSVSKSIVWLAIQPLIDEGKLDPDALISHYLPDLSKSAFGDAKVSQVAAMTTSLTPDGEYSNLGDEFSRYLMAGNFMPGENKPQGLLAFIRNMKKADHPQGSKFSYSTSNTDVMCLIAEKIEDKPAWQIIEDNVWKKIGAERDAFILLDNKGQSFCGAGMSATTRDIARLGQFVLNTITGKTPRFDSPGLANLLTDSGDENAWIANYNGKKERKNEGYNHFWWFSGEKKQIISARGINGQLLIINPEKDIVIVMNASLKDPLFPADRVFQLGVASQITDELSKEQ